MILVALGNAVHGDLMLARFHADPRIASVEYLLYERMPDRPQAQPLQAKGGLVISVAQGGRIFLDRDELSLPEFTGSIKAIADKIEF